MNVLITGGTGFIGSRLALKCASDGNQVKVLGLENTAAEAFNKQILLENGIDVVPVKVTEREQIFNHMEGMDVVYHLAAAQHEMNIPDSVFRDVNVEGTRTILDAAVACQVKKVMHGSTIGVYGIVNGTIDERSPCDPENIYGKTKYEGERLALSYTEKVPVTVVRIPEVYGPGDRRLLKLFKMVKKKRFFMIGNGKNLHHLIYIDDLIDGFIEVVQNRNSDGEILLFAGPRPVPTNEMVAAIASCYNHDGKFLRFPFWPFYALAAVLEVTLRPLKIQPPLHRRRMDFFKKSFSLNYEKANRIIGFSPKVDFFDGAGKTSKWYERNGLI
jgi:nucleoside-diphosphate-sugar epimerase